MPNGSLYLASLRGQPQNPGACPLSRNPPDECQVSHDVNLWLRLPKLSVLSTLYNALHTHSTRTELNCPGFSLAMPPAKCKCGQPNCEALRGLRGTSEIKLRNNDWKWLKHCETQWSTMKNNYIKIMKHATQASANYENLTSCDCPKNLLRLSKALYASYCLVTPLRLSTPASWGIRNVNQTLCWSWRTPKTFTTYHKCKVHRVRHDFMHGFVQRPKYPHPYTYMQCLSFT